ncbi:hypothetical protein Goklo_025891, partial [Gossypium klotzschianum]|nr:hypothetical protein [Gossypium klotzschianum]
EIPSDTFDHLSRLQVLYLGENKLEGILPKEIGNLTILRSLYLDNNLFE